MTHPGERVGKLQPTTSGAFGHTVPALKHPQKIGRNHGANSVDIATDIEGEGGFGCFPFIHTVDGSGERYPALDRPILGEHPGHGAADGGGVGQ